MVPMPAWTVVVAVCAMALKGADAADACAGLESEEECSAMKNCHFKDSACFEWSWDDKDAGDADVDKEEKGIGTMDGEPMFTVESLAFAGGTRPYVEFLPAASPPTAIAVVLFPSGIDTLGYACAGAIGNVPEMTNAVVLCPAPDLIEPSSPAPGDGKGGGDGGPCWQAFQEYGYCAGNGPESSADVEFIDALIAHARATHALAADATVVVSGFSNGGSMAFRFFCERPRSFDALVVVGQAWFDPTIGYYDYANARVPEGESSCKPERATMPAFYGAVGTADVYYGAAPASEGFGALENWEAFSADVRGCEGASAAADAPAALSSLGDGGGVSCFAFEGCEDGANVQCSVEGLGHDAAPLAPLLTAAILGDGGENHGDDDASAAAMRLPLPLPLVLCAVLWALFHEHPERAFSA
mmetsp:Transcript_10460/g.34379  ORF Transcript_10460/g.34379 Transcript_10460/m.34379 type:complete len:414 (+) Transcript_10460:9-1250(+)